MIPESSGTETASHISKEGHIFLLVLPSFLITRTLKQLVDADELALLPQGNHTCQKRHYNPRAHALLPSCTSRHPVMILFYIILFLILAGLCSCILHSHAHQKIHWREELKKTGGVFHS